MAKPDSLGQFEQLVLTAILTRGDDAYGVSIHSKVEELARPKAVSLGAVYVTLDRLEDKGLVKSWLSDLRWSYNAATSGSDQWHG